MTFRLKRFQSTDPDLLEKLHRASKVVVTPCKNLPGNRSSSYDDRFIMDLAAKKKAAIISNDNYSDLLKENEGELEIVLYIIDLANIFH